MRFDKITISVEIHTTHPGNLAKNTMKKTFDYENYDHYTHLVQDLLKTLCDEKVVTHDEISLMADELQGRYPHRLKRTP